VRLSIGQTLSSDALDREFGPRRIIEAERRPIIVVEVKFAQIPFQVLLADMVINAADPALQN
jgi:hypothetical protein